DLYRKPFRETHTDTHLIQAAGIPKASNAHYLCWPSWLLAASASDPWAGLGSASEPWTGSQEDLMLLSQVRRISLLFRLKDISSGRWQMAATLLKHDPPAQTPPGLYRQLEDLDTSLVQVMGEEECLGNGGPYTGHEQFTSRESLSI
ncbi:hypothetical protein E2I00_002062, partial [Balaenoptera physalus]